MKQYLIYLFLIILVFSCNYENQNNHISSSFKLRIDTVIINDDICPQETSFLYVSSVCCFDGKYIIEFETDNYQPRFCSLSSDLRMLTRFPVPSDICRSEFMYVRNDSLMMDGCDYWPITWKRCFDTANSEWKDLTAKENNEYKFEICYEDESYIVSYSPRIQRIGYLIFEEKTTKQKHLTYSFSLMKLLGKGGIYYLIGTFGVDKISSPNNCIFNDSIYSGNVQSCFGDTVLRVNANWFTNCSDTTFYSGLTIQDTLYLLVNDKDHTHILKLEHDSLCSVFDFALKLDIQDYDAWPYIGDTYQDRVLRPFYWKSLDGKMQSGLIDIQGYDIHLIYLKPL